MTEIKAPTTKRCCTCKENKNLTEFQKDVSKQDKLCVQCRVCRNISTSIHHKEHYKRNKEQIKTSIFARELERKNKFWEWKQQFTCVLCGEPDIACLDFHHIDPSKKDVTISKIIKYWSWEKIMKETDKCVVVCSNCHRKIHAGSISLVPQHLEY